MFRYFSNRELATRLGINLARWKRWSREFLAPDPLGGFQSGYARQFHPDDAFRVFLGGHLVSRLHASIPEAKRILDDLEEWLKLQRFTFDPQPVTGGLDGIGALVERFVIHIFPARRQDSATDPFSYQIRGRIDDQAVEYRGFSVRQERYLQYCLPASAQTPAPGSDSPKVLHITAVLLNFVGQLALPRSHYGTLNPSGR